VEQEYGRDVEGQWPGRSEDDKDEGDGQRGALGSVREGGKLNSTLLDAFIEGKGVNFNEDCDFHKEDENDNKDDDDNYDNYLVFDATTNFVVLF
jgi:hypothetical protein